MTDKNNNDKKVLRAPLSGGPAGGELDAAGKSLSEALRVSFIILKIIMIVLVIAFLASGLRRVGSDEKALVLRFGKIRGVGEKRILGPGPKLLFPYPIHEVVKIPVEKNVNLAINSFWYYQTPQEILAEAEGSIIPVRVKPTLDPVADGYCITRSEKQNRASIGSDGSDYSILHTKWQLTYQIDDAERFFRNVYVEDIKPGQIYFDVIKASVTALLQSLSEHAVVAVMVNYTVDEIMFERVAKVRDDVEKLLQENLDKIDSGIKVVSVQLTNKIWPRQVHAAFQASLMASQERPKAVSEAKTYAEQTLNEAGGGVAEELFEVLSGTRTVSEQEEEFLWDNLAGQAQEKITKAKAYRATVVDTAEAYAKYLHQLLPEYRKRPELVLQGIYWDAIEQVLKKAGEKFIIQPAEGVKAHEIRVIINRNPNLK